MRRDRATAPTTILVANLTGQLDADGNPVKARTGFTHQHIMGDRGRFAARGLVVGGDTPAPATATLTVVDNDFSTGDALLYLGAYELVSALHYAIGGDVNVTATNIAAAIDNLEEFAAVAAGPVVSIDGPVGLAGTEVTLEAVFEGTIANYTLAPTFGLMTEGSPHFGTPTVLP